MTGAPPASGATVADPADRPADQLGRRAARGSVVTLGGQLSQLVLQMSAVIVLARLLTPHDYGLYAIVLVIAGVGEIFRDFGLSAAAVQARSVSEEQRSNLFWVNTALGLVLAALVFASAPLVAAAFGQDELVGMVRLLSLIFVVNGMTTQFRADLNRRMKFALIAGADLAGQLVNVTVAIVGAALGGRYWALVGSQLAQVTTILLMVVIAGRWRPRRWDRGAEVGSFIRFGRHFVGAQLVNYVGNNVDSTTIGLRFGAAPLGLYNRAFQLLMNPLNQIRTPATTVALPVLSRLQDDEPRANAYVARGQIIIGYTVVLGLGVVVGAAQPVVALLLGDRWQQVDTVLALLALAAAFQMLSFVGYWIYLSRGLTKDLFRYSLVSFAIKVVCVLVGSTWGLVGVAAGYAVAPAIAWPISLWWLSRRTFLPLADLYRGAATVLALGSAVGVSSFAVCRAAADLVPVLQVALALAAGAVTVLVAALVFPRVRRDLRTVVEVGRKVLPS